MKRFIIYIVGISSVLFLWNCTRDNNPIDKSISVVSGDDNKVENQFDKYLKEKVLTPYNVNIIYKYKDGETPQAYTVVPSSYENSIKMANLLIYLCFDAYNAVAPGFIRDHFPKDVFLVGSAAFKNNGTRILGEAAGGKKITLYEINDLNEKNINVLYDNYFRTIYHEFSHILHQKIEYSRDFNRISEKDYVGALWNEAWDEKPVGERSIDKGFISNYASSEANEDFVELIAHYVTNTPDSWEKILEGAGKGKPILEQKIEIVKTYLKSTWNLDLDMLRDEIDRRAKAINSQDLSNIKI